MYIYIYIVIYIHTYIIMYIYIYIIIILLQNIFETVITFMLRLNKNAKILVLFSVV